MRLPQLLGTVALICLSASCAAAASSVGLSQPPTPPETRVTAPASSPFFGAQGIALKNISPLYREPKLPGEGIWIKEDVCGGRDVADLVYRTFYRPSEQFPNAIVYMMMLNMKHISANLYLGSAEPYRRESPSKIEDAKQPQLLAVTNALWQTRHAGGGGIILDGTVLKEMKAGLATIVFYKNDTVDIVEWNDEIPVSEVRDARQLKHLMVKDGKVVTSIVKRGSIMSAEIGIGSLLNEDNPVVVVPASAPGEKPTTKLNFTTGDLWFLATRSAFGIRPDGNLVFAVGHHINTIDLAKALVLAGCLRGLHGDANPGNSVGIIYSTDGNGRIVNKIRLSPRQDKSTLQRYLKATYPKDFIGFFRRPPTGS